MKLQLDGDRVIGWCAGEGNGIDVQEAPPFPCRDYRYVNGEYIYDPIPENEPEEIGITNEELIDAVTELAEMVSTIEDAIVELAGLMEGGD